MKRWLCAFILGMAVLAVLPAATVSFVVVETGLPEGSVQPESSARWEGGVMGVFFDAGHIVFNAPVTRLERKLPAGTNTVPPELRGEFDEAKAGGADYFVMVLLEYPGGTETPKSIQLRLFNAATGTLLYETSCAGNAGASPQDELLDVKTNALKLIPRLNRKG
jgi:hypothetical protein